MELQTKALLTVPVADTPVTSTVFGMDAIPVPISLAAHTPVQKH